MNDELWTKTGEEVAMEQLALFFNNSTILYGMEQLKSGMTKKEAQSALEAAGFDEVLAEAFLKKMYNNVNLTWHQGRLMLPSAVEHGRGIE